ncbi:hypothetical protein KIS4809_1040 [Bacillus sp. ZZV12-4809]|nr:hypothetical protein KIS4809_1040 [Bacillus sp. ZZV12-4809]
MYKPGKYKTDFEETYQKNSEKFKIIREKYLHTGEWPKRESL